MNIDPNMLMYFASTLGQGLMSPDDPMQGVAGATKQTIATQNYMKMVKQMLAGGSKFTMDKDKFTLGGPSTLLGDVSGLLKDEKVPFKGAPSGMAMNVPGGQLNTQQDQLRQSFLNPSNGSLDIFSAGLVGLTPENISQALQLKFTKESLEQKKLSDFAKMMQAIQPGPAAPIEVPGLGKLSLKQWSSLPTNDRSYYLYAASAKQRGEEAMTKEDWVASTDVNTRIQYLEGLEGDEDLKSLAIELAQAGSVKIDIGGREVEKGLGKGQAEVMSPGFSQDVKVDLMKDKANWPSDLLIKQYTDKGLSYTEAETRVQKRMVLETMDKQIRQAFKGKEITLGEEGWEIDGELKVRYP